MADSVEKEGKKMEDNEVIDKLRKDMATLREIVDSQQNDCAHRRPDNTSAISGQQQHDGSLTVICMACMKTETYKPHTVSYLLSPAVYRHFKELSEMPESWEVTVTGAGCGPEGKVEIRRKDEELDNFLWAVVRQLHSGKRVFGQILSAPTSDEMRTVLVSPDTEEEIATSLAAEAAVAELLDLGFPSVGKWLEENSDKVDQAMTLLRTIEKKEIGR